MRHEDINGVIWEVTVVNQTWAAAPSKDSPRTYTNPGANIDGTQTIAGAPVIVSWPREGEPGLFGKLPAAQIATTINGWARQVTSNPTAKAQVLTLRVTASPDSDNGALILIALIVAALVFGKGKRR